MATAAWVKAMTKKLAPHQNLFVLFLIIMGPRLCIFGIAVILGLKSNYASGLQRSCRNFPHQAVLTLTDCGGQ